MTLGPETDAVFWFFLITLVVLSIAMVLAAVPFTVALVAHPRDITAKPVGVAELRAALLTLNTPERKWRLVPLSDTEMRVEWDVVDASWYELFAAVKLTTVYRARLLLYEPEYEVRCHEMLRSADFFIGFEGLSGLRGLRPRFNFNFEYHSGSMNVIWTGLAYGIKKGWPPRIGQVYRFTLDTVEVKREIEDVASKMGWYFRPVVLWFDVTGRGAALAERLTPPFMRGWSRKRFWGSIYAAAWAGIIALCLSFVPWTGNNLLILAMMVGVFCTGQAVVVGWWRGLEWFSRRRANGRRTKFR